MDILRNDILSKTWVKNERCINQELILEVVSVLQALEEEAQLCF